MNNRIFISILLFAFVAQNVFSQNNDNPYNLVFNCYDTFPADEGDILLGYYEYIGQDDNIPTTEIIIKDTPAETKWEKRKADRNCISADPNDCLVWGLVEIPAEYESIQIITDTTLTEDWKYYYVKTEKESHIDLDLVCSDEIPLTFLEDLKYFLNNEGFNIKHSKRYTKLNGRLRVALNEYQQKCKLPVGGLTNKTYQFLLKSGLRR